MQNVLLCERFRKGLDRLDPVMKNRVVETIRKLCQNPDHSSLDTKIAHDFQRRRIRRSRVNDNFRLLWEYDDNGQICLWRVGKHEVIDRTLSLNALCQVGWEEWEDTPEDSPAFCGDYPPAKPVFARFSPDLLRLLGVPDELVAAVGQVPDAEELEDLPLPTDVLNTLLGVYTDPLNFIEDEALDPRQLLYRASADELEGYCRGELKKLLLNLAPAQEALVTFQPNGPVLIKGVAGSGKTTIGLYRARYLAQLIADRRRMFHEETSILILTYTKTLARALRELMIELYGAQHPLITVFPIRKWMEEFVFANGERRAADKKTRHKISKAILARMREEKGGRHRDFFDEARTDFFLDEIDTVIRARGVDKLEKYQQMERVGRGKALSQEQRALVWEFYRRYQGALNEEQRFDYADLARLALHHLESMAAEARPAFDAVIVDEAQDLTPMDLRLAARLVADQARQIGLTLLADPAQSIYYRGIPWKESGIAIAGRTRTLLTNYRNTEEILRAARPILDGCATLQIEEEYLQPRTAGKRGPAPLIRRYNEHADCDRFIVEEIYRLCQERRYRPGDIAILVPVRNEMSALRKALEQGQIPTCDYRDEEFDLLENEVKLITIHSAKGLEFPVVFLPYLEDEHFNWLCAPHGEEGEQKPDAARMLFYVGMTRAADRLYLLYPRHARLALLHDLDPATLRDYPAENARFWSADRVPG